MRELPSLLRLDPGLVIVPPTFPDVDPNEDKRLQKGKQSEKRIFENLVSALTNMHQQDSDLVISLFHGLRYGYTFEQGQVDERKWEGEIDMAVLCWNKSNGNKSRNHSIEKNIYNPASNAKESKLLKTALQ